MRLLSLSEASMQPRTSRLKLKKKEKKEKTTPAAPGTGYQAVEGVYARSDVEYRGRPTYEKNESGLEERERRFMYFEVHTRSPAWVYPAGQLIVYRMNSV